MPITPKHFRIGFVATIFAVVATSCIGFAPGFCQDQRPRNSEWRLQLRYRTETSQGSGRFHTLTRDESWTPEKTVIIVCDVWDSHHSINAVRRVGEIAPRIDLLLKQARRQGATIIHAPSDCMESYTEHPARHRALNAPADPMLPPYMSSWRSRIDSEIGAMYPVDQSDGGDDDDPADHALWVKELQSQGRKTGTPWLAQSPLIEIDPKLDFISDKGDEVWNILQSRKIDTVVLVGVHTNMCVLGRPFGLRNMVAAGKKVALVRDLTDTMYNPKRWPFVNHHMGTDRVIEYIEKYVCPTFTSDQILGGKLIRFASDKRPLVAIVMAEDEYATDQTLPRFAENYLGDEFRVALVFASDNNPNEIPGLEILDEADAAIISVRRRPLATPQMAIVRRFVQSKKPVLGIRTASHAFVSSDGATSDGLEAWPEFDAQVFGGNYTGHYGNDELPTIFRLPDMAFEPILYWVSAGGPFANGSLYKTSPIDKTAATLLWGRIPSHAGQEPVAWVFKRADGGKSFYTSLGHKLDFENSDFKQLLYNAVCWATNRESNKLRESPEPNDSVDSHWLLVNVPTKPPSEITSEHGPAKASSWYRCFFKLNRDDKLDSIEFKYADDTRVANAWINSHEVAIRNMGSKWIASVPVDYAVPGDLNLLVIRFGNDESDNSLPAAPILKLEKREINLSGRWQFRIDDDQANSSLPLPPKFGASPDVIFE